MDSVVFDMMGVIYTEGHFVSGLFNKWFGHRVPPEDIKNIYLEFALAEISRDEFWARLTDEPDEYERRFFEAMELMPDLDLIRDLKGRCCLGLLSEIPAEWGTRLLEKAGLADFFDVKVVSGVDRLNKPEPEIYQLLMSRLSEEGRKIFIDDRLENLEPAAEFGIITILMEGPKFRPHPYKPDYRAKNLIEAREIVGQILSI